MKTSPFVKRIAPRPERWIPSAEASLIAGVLGNQPNLRHWLLAVVGPLGREGAALLMRAARTLRGEFAEFATASLLDRLANEPALRTAVLSELQISPPAGSNSALRF